MLRQCNKKKKETVSLMILFLLLRIRCISVLHLILLKCIPVITRQLDDLLFHAVFLGLRVCGSLSPRHGASSGCGWRNGFRYGG